MDENTLRSLNDEIKIIENEINEFPKKYLIHYVDPENDAFHIIAGYLALFQRKEALYRLYYQMLHVEFIKELSSIKQELYRIGQELRNSRG